jgi:predicted exporter
MERRSRGARIDFETGHTLSPDGRAAILQVWGKKSPRDIEYARRFTNALRRAVEALRKDERYGAGLVEVRLTGGYPVALENERSVKRNLVVSCLGAFLGVLLLFTIVFRSLRVNLTVGLPLAVGVSVAFGSAAVALGFEMTAIAAAFGAILVGLGIDFPIHLYHRFREELSSGADKEAAVRSSLSRTGPGVISAGITTALAFTMLAAGGFRGMIEVGLFVGIGMVALLAVMFTLLPALFVLVEVRGPSRVGTRANGPMAWLEKAHRKAGIPLMLLGMAAVLLCGLDLAFRGPAHFESDVRALKTPSPEADGANEAIGTHFGVSLNPL